MDGIYKMLLDVMLSFLVGLIVAAIAVDGMVDNKVETIMRIDVQPSSYEAWRAGSSDVNLDDVTNDINLMISWYTMHGLEAPKWLRKDVEKLSAHYNTISVQVGSTNGDTREDRHGQSRSAMPNRVRPRKSRSD